LTQTHAPHAVKKIALFLLALAVLEGALAFGAGGHPLWDGQVPWTATALFWLNVQALNLCAVCVLLAGLRLRVHRYSVAIVLGVLTFFYINSWGTFFSIGVFTDVESLAFLWHIGPQEVTQHAVSFDRKGVLLSAAFSAAAVAASLALVSPLVRFAACLSWGFVARMGVVAAAILALVFVSVAAVSTVRGEFLYGTLRRLTSYETYIAHQLAYRSTPFGVFLGRLMPYDMGKALFPDPVLKEKAQAALEAGQIQVILPPRVAASSYVEAVPPSAWPTKNVVLILIESLRNDVLQSFGGSREIMPNLDRWAQRSVRFQNSYAQAAYSALADPATMIGHYPMRHLRFSAFPTPITYPRDAVFDLLQLMNYKAAVFSSQNERWADMAKLLYFDKPGFNQLQFFHAGNYGDKGQYIPDHDGTSVSDWLRKEGAFKDRVGYAGKIDDAVTVQVALGWLETFRARTPERPFFMYLNLQNSHFPYTVPPGQPKPFEEGARDFPMHFGKFPPERAPHVYNRYANALHYVDRQLGLFFEHLEKTGLADTTIVVVAGDNGEAFYEHDVSGHGGALYEEMIRTPLLISAPGLKAHDRAEPVEQIDIPPTVLGLLSLPGFTGFQGYDALGELPEHRLRFVVTNGGFSHQRVLVHQGWKLIEDLRWKRYELYNLANDPQEKVDLSRAHPVRLEQMATWLYVWRDTQLAYYRDRALHQKFFPPRMMVKGVDQAEIVFEKRK
jgi:arylsulfatase A-like enzyme